MDTSSHALAERILFLAPTARDAQMTQQFLARAGLSGVPCADIENLCREFERGAGAMLVTQEALLSDSTQCLSRALRNQPFWSDCPLVVLTTAGEETRQQMEALESVGHMTLMKRPLQVSALISTLRSALRDRRRQYEVRDLLALREEQAAALQEAVARAEAASRAKSEFLANMSHEIRTPMNAIVGLTRLLSHSGVPPQKQKEFLDTLQLSAQALLELINDLLDISKIENESVELERVPFNLKTVIDEIASIMTVRVREKGIALAIERDPECESEFIGDPLRLKQIVMNLLGNAIKFTEKGKVTLKVTQQPGPDSQTRMVSFAVSDTGIGIAEDKLHTIFDKFLQADNSITRRYGGTGLGLTITKRLVTLMGGDIEVASEEGKGSAFTVRLPMARVMQAQLPFEKDSAWNGRAPAGIGEAPSILLVEDYEANILVAHTILEQLGYRCAVAHNGREAVSAMERHRFDAVLMDVQMPVLDGYSATRHIRRDERERGLARTPIIGITAYALAGDRDKCLQAGMDDYIAKPFRPEELQKKIASSLKRREGEKLPA